MERTHRFTITLDDVTYDVALLEGVDVEHNAAGVTGHWPDFELNASADTEAEVYTALLQALQQQNGADPESPEHQRFAGYVRERGTRLSEDEAFARKVEAYRKVRLRWSVSDDEQYHVPVFKDVDVQRGDGEVTVRVFEVQASGPALPAALTSLTKAIDEAYGSVDAPGPQFAEITEWVRQHGEPVSAETLAQEAADKAAYLVARDQIPAIEPDDITAESSTGVPLLVDFWAQWCGPCRMVTPVLAELAQQWAGRILIRKIDVDQYDGIWDRFGFRGIPALLLFRDGEEIHRIQGFGGKQSLIQELEQQLR